MADKVNTVRFDIVEFGIGDEDEYKALLKYDKDADSLMLGTGVFQRAKEIEDEKIDNILNQPKTTDSIEECRKCKKHTVSWSTIQTRSSDEPATIFYCCRNCSHCIVHRKQYLDACFDLFGLHYASGIFLH